MPFLLRSAALTPRYRRTAVAASRSRSRRS